MIVDNGFGSAVPGGTGQAVVADNTSITDGATEAGNTQRLQGHGAHHRTTKVVEQFISEMKHYARRQVEYSTCHLGISE